MGMVTLVQGFKLSVSAFDAFLAANGMEILGGGFLPKGEMAKDIAKLFRAHGVECEVKVFAPFAEGYDLSRNLFICCDWVSVLASRDIEGLLQKPAPPTFEQMRTSLGAESGISRYIICTEDTASLEYPEEVTKDLTPPFECGVCDVVFGVWEERMTHRHEEHGISEDLYPLPEY